MDGTLSNYKHTELSIQNLRTLSLQEHVFLLYLTYISTRINAIKSIQTFISTTCDTFLLTYESMGGPAE